MAIMLPATWGLHPPDGTFSSPRTPIAFAHVGCGLFPSPESDRLGEGTPAGQPEARGRRVRAPTLPATSTARPTTGSSRRRLYTLSARPLKRWGIFNQDRVPVSAGSAFEVAVRGESEALVHRATPENASANVTHVNDPLTYGKPEALISVTQNWNPGGGIGVYNDHPVGVRYDAERGK